MELKIGSKGPEVERLQRQLGLKADGDFGPKTDAAVKAYQQKHGLKVDGVVGIKTWDHIMSRQSSSGIILKKENFTYDKVKEVMLRLGYPFVEEEGKVNMIGVRSSNRSVDNWDDFFILTSIEGGKKMIWVNDQFTTDPGIYYMTQKLLNPAGCGILVPGFYKDVWVIGGHGPTKYEALIQLGNKVRAYRDRNKDNFMDFDPKTIQEGWFGCNQHHGYDSGRVSKNSAMCQVHRYKKDLAHVLKYAKKSGMKKFSYALLEVVDFV